MLKILAEPTRVRIILALRRTPELSVNSLAQVVGKSGPGEPQHLAKLRMARMVTTRQDGTRVLYRLADRHPALLVEQAIKQAEHSVSHGQNRPHHHHAEPALNLDPQPPKTRQFADAERSAQSHLFQARQCSGHCADRNWIVDRRVGVARLRHRWR
ncbi:ArsR/SmtB family transcription factor [Nesterenkonia aurantiaca]|uniref:ArsR/SmtB family transcription factor n=1 Tax=Nesterenkonia aurantiaca TaxID=1436010 RepID=UPI003EE75F97